MPSTLLKFFQSYQPNSERVLRHGSHYYKWVQHFMKISLRLHEGNLKNSKIPIFLLNKSSYISDLNLVPPLSAAPHSPRVIQGCPKKPKRVVGWPLKTAEKLLFFDWIRTPWPLTNTKKCKKNICLLQGSTWGPMDCKTNMLPLRHWGNYTKLTKKIIYMITS